MATPRRPTRDLAQPGWVIYPKAQRSPHEIQELFDRVIEICREDEILRRGLFDALKNMGRGKRGNRMRTRSQLSQEQLRAIVHRQFEVFHAVLGHSKAKSIAAIATSWALTNKQIEHIVYPTRKRKTSPRK